MTIVGTCRLCLAGNVELQQSHIVPGWAHKRIRRDSARDPLSKNNNPVLVSFETAVQVSTELKEHMLCALCEQRIGNRENWFKQLTEPTNGLPLLSELLELPRLDLGCGYPGAPVGRLDVDSLVYFGLSVIWRAHESSKTPELQLEAPVAEAVRRYLHNDTALPNWLTLSVFFSEDAYRVRAGLVSGFETPWSQDGKQCFTIACLAFVLGRTAGVSPRHTCLLHSLDKVLIMVPAEVFAGRMRARAAAAIPKGTLRNYLHARGGLRNG